MPESIEALVAVLQQSERLYAELATVLEQEPEAVLARDMERLTNVSAEKERLLSRLSELGQRQARLKHQIARSLALPADSSLTELAGRLPEPSGQQLRMAGGRLRETLQHVQLLNRQSRLMIRHCLKMVQNSLSFLTSWSVPTPVYAASGTLGSGSRGGRLLSSTI